MKEKYPDTIGVLNKEVDLIWDTSDYPDEHYAGVMDSFYLPESESYNGRRTVDVRQLKYKYKLDGYRSNS